MKEFQNYLRFLVLPQPIGITKRHVPPEIFSKEIFFDLGETRVAKKLLPKKFKNKSIVHVFTYFFQLIHK